MPDVELGASSARANVSSGKGTSAEALTAEASAARLKNRILQVESEARQAQVELARWVGEAGDCTLAPMPAFDELPVSPATLLTTPHLHGTILPYAARLAEARADIALARAERRPDWSTELTFAKRGAAFSDMVSLQFTVGLPLFAKTRQNPVIAARNADFKRVEAERDSEVRMHTTELRQMVIEWQQRGEQLEQYRTELLPLARERSRAALAGYRGGRSDLRLALEAFHDEIDLLVEQASCKTSAAVPGRTCDICSFSEANMKHTRLILPLVIVLLVGAALGYGLARRSAAPDSGVVDRKVLYWHDPMVPGQKFDKPGKSPSWTCSSCRSTRTRQLLMGPFA